MEKGFREFQIFAKPVGASCNLRCKYCYYLDKKSLHHGRRSLVMSDDILERYIVQHIEASTEETISFSWHGGEPLLAGMETFKKIVAMQKKHKPFGRAIMNGIQTNCTLINEDWASFLSEENFMVGLSIDGPGYLHNRHRKTVAGKPTLQLVLKGFEILQKHGVVCEFLCVVHSGNVNYPLVVYNFFKQMGTRYLTFLPLVEKLPATGSSVSKLSVPSMEFGKFLSTIFDEWIEKDIGSMKIQIFEEAIRPAFRQEHTLCIFKEVCGGVPVIELNGDFYSCDHYVDSDHCIGNITEGSIAGFLDDEKQRRFGEAKLYSLPGYCKACEVRSMCNGECPKNRFICTPDGEPGLNYLCSGYKLFFNHCRPFVEAIAETWKNQRADFISTSL
jgi:uncharacterized protein